MRTSGLPRDLGEELVRAAHAGRAAGGEHDGGDVRPLSGARLVARLRPRDDLHQQAADAHAGDGLARHRQAGEKPHQHPVEAVLLRASARSPARRAPAGRARRRSAAGCRDRPACRNARCARRCASTAGRNDVAPVGDRRGAEHDDELGALASTSSIACASARCSCGTRRSATMLAPAGASRSAVTCSVFSITLVARPGSSVETTPTLRMR